MFRETIYEILEQSRFAKHVRVVEHMHLEDPRFKQRGRLYEAVDIREEGAGKSRKTECRTSRCRDFALRVYDAGIDGNDNIRGIPASILRQSQGLELKHPNLLAFYDMDVVYKPNCRDVVTGKCEPAYVILLMELASGNLSHWLTVNRQRSAPTIGRIAFDILCGLEYLHSNGLIHSRLHPGNILMVEVEAKGDRDQMTAKIADFQTTGWENTEMENTEKDFTVSRFTVSRFSRYASPEVLMGNKRYQASDIWSFGVILFEMLMGDGRTPFLDSKHDGRPTKTSERSFVLSSIFQWLGVPDMEWRKKYTNRTDIAWDAYEPSSFTERLHEFFPETKNNKREMSEILDLVSKCLVLDPEKRLTASKALEHPLFRGLKKPKYKPIKKIHPGKPRLVPDDIVESVIRDIKQEIVPKFPAILSIYLLEKFLTLKPELRFKVYIYHCAAYLISVKLVTSLDFDDIKGHVCGASDTDRVNVMLAEREICKLLKFKFDIISLKI